MYLSKKYTCVRSDALYIGKSSLLKTSMGSLKSRKLKTLNCSTLMLATFFSKPAKFIKHGISMPSCDRSTESAAFLPLDNESYLFAS